MSFPTRTRTHELLDYFGRCAKCGYPSSAMQITRQYADGSTEHEIIATCGLPCGWRGPVPMTRMTARMP